jgi:RNA-directed DNA polymerase
VISPVLANIALDGMQSFIGPKFGFIRYADDFVVTARSKEALETLKPKIEIWLKQRGLQLNEEKTRIVSVLDGFDFLGFHIQHFQGKCLTKPQKAKVLAFVAKLKEWLHTHPSITPEVVIRRINPILIGWANFYKHSASKRVFGYVDSQLWKAIWRWCLFRHPKKNKGWVKQKYFALFKGRQWSFFAKAKDGKGNDIVLHLAAMSDVKIKRHPKVKGTASPDDPSLKEYWEKRRKRSNDAPLVVREDLLAMNWRLELIEG